AAALAAGADFVRYLRVHSGPWSGGGSRWPQATGRVLERGDVVVLDIIGAYRGYGFDVNRTTVVGRAATLADEDRRLLEAGLAATEAAVAATRSGAAIGAVVEAGRRAVVEAGFAEVAPAGAGHAIGLETVEEPYLSAGGDERLEVGMVLCIEPSIFVPGRIGCAIEQEVIVRDGAPEVITEFPTRLW
ncbi:MAG: M24 family metallopeptidase, partial [Chloroflexota bacterium]|nr:M24 family metallopeptidase [Chloroflexota bacterium]